MLRSRPHTGSALLLVVILLGVLAAIAGATVALSSRDRINASAKSRRDLVVSCANAAQMKVWAELARYGPKWFGDFAGTETVLADGTRLAPVHYDQAASVQIKDVVVTFTDPIGSEMAKDMTNRSQALMNQGNAKRAVARCVIPGGAFSPDRVLEIEFSMRLPTK